MGSQINDIAVVSDALQEASRIYVELHKLGAPMGYLDVGGGLGIDYDGSRTATAASTKAPFRTTPMTWWRRSRRL